jgi:hypothetical protein
MLPLVLTYSLQKVLIDGSGVVMAIWSLWMSTILLCTCSRVGYSGLYLPNMAANGLASNTARMYAILPPFT